MSQRCPLGLKLAWMMAVGFGLVEQGRSHHPALSAQGRLEASVCLTLHTAAVSRLVDPTHLAGGLATPGSALVRLQLECCQPLRSLLSLQWQLRRAGAHLGSSQKQQPLSQAIWAHRLALPQRAHGALRLVSLWMASGWQQLQVTSRAHAWLALSASWQPH